MTKKKRNFKTGNRENLWLAEILLAVRHFLKNQPHSPLGKKNVILRSQSNYKKHIMYSIFTEYTVANNQSIGPVQCTITDIKGTVSRDFPYFFINKTPSGPHINRQNRRCQIFRFCEDIILKYDSPLAQRINCVSMLSRRIMRTRDFRTCDWLSSRKTKKFAKTF